ncbi:hypothetical protein Pyn_26568 [Prunus yedoensis var. nudiflora]|uniref:Peripheral subunit-binding (PSBD) domain-containing protein n=1 Tax=Prunus yedoensis var. nudiflora TaxID=2094558 RepID=A0A314Y887_PRUYE|nr:hypothetical protein Pyn_26568 [Prunus yedoensis var. nudiflora]
MIARRAWHKRALVSGRRWLCPYTSSAPLPATVHSGRSPPFRAFSSELVAFSTVASTPFRFAVPISNVGEILLKMAVEESQVPNQISESLENTKSLDSELNTQNIGGVLSTPPVRNLAKQYDIDINEVDGTGKDGRVLKGDVLKYAAQKGIIQDSSASLSASSDKVLGDEKSYSHPSAESGCNYDDKTVTLRGFQRRMVKSMSMAAKVPHFHYVEEIKCDALVELKQSFQIASMKSPLEVILKGSHNIGIAMATPYGLVVPIIKNVQSISILEITKELSRLQQLALENKLRPEDISGGTITLSNIGAIGGKYGSPLLNLPEVAIIALGRIQKVPQFADDGNVYPVSIMTVNIGADHRVLDGATVASSQLAKYSLLAAGVATKMLLLCIDNFQAVYKQEPWLKRNPKPFGFLSMAIKMHLHILVWLLALSFGTKILTSDEAAMPAFTFSWMDDKDTFRAGDTATIRIRALNNFDKLDKNAFKPTLTVNGKPGNSSFVSGVLSDFEADPTSWKLFFTTITAGLFNVMINEDRYRVFDSSLHFQVQPGKMYPSGCVVSWMGLGHEFEAGTKARVLILPKDAFGNNINISESSEDPKLHNFTVSAFYANESIASVPEITHLVWNEFGYIIVEFLVVKAGDLFLYVGGGNETLNGSPLPFKVNPGPLEVSNSVAKWDFEPNAWQLYSKMEVLIHQQDRYGNLVPGLYAFDAEVVEIETNLSIPVADLHFEEVVAGIQLFSFSNLEPGNFLLTISDMKHDKSISNMPYAYTVFVGYCNGTNSVVNGSGLNSSTAGERAEFSVYLNDAYQYPSPVEIERLEVQLVRETDSYRVQSSIFPMQIINVCLSKLGTGPARGIRYGATSQIEITPSPSMDSANSSVGSFGTLATAFNVVYTPDKSGIYKIFVLCGNILLNGGQPFTMEVRGGEVNTSLSQVVKFSPKVPKMINNDVVVQLVDSFFNPVLSQQSRLKLDIVSVNSSGFSSSVFVDNRNGSYTVHYLAEDVGSYEMCASFEGKQVSPCPVGVNVYSTNDYFAGKNASVVEFSKPGHGSLLEYGRLLRYTPQKDYYGNDSFVYTMSDINGNLATAAVNISVLTIPPQFVSFPTELQATEDEISPRFGGFPGFEIRYSDMMESISVNLSAQSGTVFLAPMLMQFWEPVWTGLSVYKEDGEVKGLILEGNVEVINFALQSIQYYGNENFCGYDTVRVSTRNRNGVNVLDIPVLVEPINDPPFIHAPAYIILKNNEDESLIYDREKDKFEFCIGDPDLLAFHGNESLFAVTFSVEVNDGFLVTSLPAELIATTELKIKNSYQWLPLQTYVSISKHFMVKAKGVRFHGTVNDCNSVMQQLFYHGGEQDAILTVTLNDMGNYGCYFNCAEKISVPLQAEASVNLIRRRPMSSLVAHGLGSAIVLEAIIVFSLGSALLFFTCKCATHLVNERRNRATRGPEPESTHRLRKGTPKTNVSEHATHLTGSCSSPLLGSQRPNFRQRSSCRQFGDEESSKAAYQRFPSTSGRSQHTPAPSFMALAIEKEQSETV